MRILDVDTAIQDIVSQKDFQAPEPFVATIQNLTKQLNGQQVILLEILRELRSIRERMSLDAACGFKSASE